MVDVDDVVVALGAAYSPVRELPDKVLRVQLKDPLTTSLEIRIEPEWIRMFVWLGGAPSDQAQLRALIRANEAFRHVRYGVEDSQSVLRADVPARLWSPDHLVRVVAEIDHAVSARGRMP